MTRPAGNWNADIAIVGEYPSANDMKAGYPFASENTGVELTRLLGEAGIVRRDCFMTNVVRIPLGRQGIKSVFVNKTEAKRTGVKEQDGKYPLRVVIEGVVELIAELKRVRPRVILTLGELPLWALTGNNGITKWRGSYLEVNLAERFCDPELPTSVMVIPTYHPRMVQKKYEWRFISSHDIKKVTKYLNGEVKKPDYNFIIRPDFQQAKETLALLKAKADAAFDRNETIHLSHDIETRLGHIACSGIAWNNTDAICIPWMCVERREGYWPIEQEQELILSIRQLFNHPAVSIVGQNYAYDAQYTAKWWGFIGNVGDDTMIKHHTCFNALPKGLDFLSSLYCQWHVYWKDEGKEWDKNLDEEQLWVYNCKDAVTTYEVNHQIPIEAMNMAENYAFQMTRWWGAVRAMLRGVKWNKPQQAKLQMQLWEQMETLSSFLERIISPEIWPRDPKKKPFYRSPQQLATLLYTRLGCKPIYKIDRATGRRSLTTDDEALTEVATREPLLKPFLDTILLYRSLGVLYSTFVCASIDVDGYVRCSYNVAGTGTYRFSSSEDAFGHGMNLQNITKGEEK